MKGKRYLVMCKGRKIDEYDTFSEANHMATGLNWDTGHWGNGKEIYWVVDNMVNTPAKL